MSRTPPTSGVHRQWFGTHTPERYRTGPIVLLHEGLGSLSTWGQFPARLANTCERPVLAYDRRGYGRSPAHPAPWPADFMHLEAIELARLLIEEDIENPILVGHSDGATIALLYPHECLSEGPRPPGADPRHPAPAPTGIVSLAAHLFVEQVCVDEIEQMRAGQREQLVKRLAPHHDDAANVFEGWSEVWTSERFRTWAIDDELSAVTCPVLAFQGEEDTYATRQQLQRMEAAVHGPIELVDLPGCDHWPHREATDDVLARIAAFCHSIDTLPA